ncbi:hypothetical protein ACIQVR_39365 [Streptomyces xanthochromogenes]|uniref:hypothetical protein n=1 Tax=Streptomyces xanthochromogenes TaxID=67384 RepID=UPI00380B3B6E
MSLSFLIGVAQFLAVFLWLGLLVLGVSGAWTLVCWIAGHQQRRNDRREAARIRQLGDRIHGEPLRPTRPGPDDQQRRQLEQLYAMPAWEDETR